MLVYSMTLSHESHCRRAVELVVIGRCVVLQIGLAVGDIAEVQKHALLKRIAMQVSAMFI